MTDNRMVSGKVKGADAMGPHPAGRRATAAAARRDRNVRVALAQPVAQPASPARRDRMGEVIGRRRTAARLPGSSDRRRVPVR
jgi:hypothetical protein